MTQNYLLVTAILIAGMLLSIATSKLKITGAIAGGAVGATVAASVGVVDVLPGDGCVGKTAITVGAIVAATVLGGWVGTVVGT